jgi:hypothetical protein
MGDVDEEPRSFQLSRGRSGLSVLFFVLVFGVVLIVAPKAGPWIMRALLVTAAIILIYCIRSVRRLRSVASWGSSSRGPVRVLVGLAVLGLWIWYTARGFAAGKWIDASIASVLVAEFAYLEWFMASRGTSGE